MTDLTERLRKCPFCGGDATIDVPHLPMLADCADVVVRCQNCDAQGQPVLFDQTVHGEDDLDALRQEAAEYWNKRATLETLTQEVERLRGLLIDPGDPAWEDARAVLAAELRKADMADHADDVVAGRSLHVPSWIALNLIAHSRKSLTQENARLTKHLNEIGLAAQVSAALCDPEDAEPFQMIADRARKALGGGDDAN